MIFARTVCSPLRIVSVQRYFVISRECRYFEVLLIHFYLVLKMLLMKQIDILLEIVFHYLSFTNLINSSFNSGDDGRGADTDIIFPFLSNSIKRGTPVIS